MKGRFRERIHRFFHHDHPDDHPYPTAECENVINFAGPSINDSLPNELLATVFLFNAGRTLSAFKDILSISHTCSQWRAVALDCPLLWTNYPFLHTINVEASQMLLKRCGDLRLNVGWDRLANLNRTSSHCNHDLFDLETDNLDRFRSYYILLSPLMRLTRVRSGFPSNWEPACPPQSLEELVVDTGDVFRYRKLPWKMVDTTSPSLRTLRLRATWFDLLTILTNNLHTLDIALPSQAMPWSAQQWMQFLQRCPNLTHLSLNLYSLPDRDEVPNAMLKSIAKESTLSSLSHLVLSAPLSFSTALINRFNLPSIRALGITWPDRDTDGDIHRMVSSIMVPLILSPTSSDNRMQICTSDVNGKVYVGFTPGNRLLDLPSQDWGQYAGEHFGSGAVSGKVPNDYFQLRMKRGAWRLNQLLPYWPQVARLVSTLHVDASRNDPISSAPIREYLLNFARKDMYTIWDYRF